MTDFMNDVNREIKCSSRRGSSPHVSCGRDRSPSPRTEYQRTARSIEHNLRGGGGMRFSFQNDWSDLGIQGNQRTTTSYGRNRDYGSFRNERFRDYNMGGGNRRYHDNRKPFTNRNNFPARINHSFRMNPYDRETSSHNWNNTSTSTPRNNDERGRLDGFSNRAESK